LAVRLHKHVQPRTHTKPVIVITILRALANSIIVIRPISQPVPNTFKGQSTASISSSLLSRTYVCCTNHSEPSYSFATNLPFWERVTIEFKGKSLQIYATWQVNDVKLYSPPSNHSDPTGLFIAESNLAPPADRETCIITSLTPTLSYCPTLPSDSVAAPLIGKKKNQHFQNRRQASKKKGVVEPKSFPPRKHGLLISIDLKPQETPPRGPKRPNENKKT
jgi:hypothetical protein